MRTLGSLKREALQSCANRGHVMGAWTDRADSKTSHCQCTVCGAWVAVETKPMPNSIDIAGSAVAISCTDNETLVYKTFNDSLPGGKPVKLEAVSIGVYMDDNGIEWTVYKPVSVVWQGVYHLVPFYGGEPWLPVCLDERRIIASWEATIQNANYDTD